VCCACDLSSIIGDARPAKPGDLVISWELAHLKADNTCSLRKRISLRWCRYEMRIEAIRLLDFYGGPSNIEPDAYFAARAATTDAHALA
jgi:hypothetical protein